MNEQVNLFYLKPINKIYLVTLTPGELIDNVLTLKLVLYSYLMPFKIHRELKFKITSTLLDLTFKRTERGFRSYLLLNRETSVFDIDLEMLINTNDVKNIKQFYMVKDTSKLYNEEFNFLQHRENYDALKINTLNAFKNVIPEDTDIKESINNKKLLLPFQMFKNNNYTYIVIGIDINNNSYMVFRMASIEDYVIERIPFNKIPNYKHVTIDPTLAINVLNKEKVIFKYSHLFYVLSDDEIIRPSFIEV